MNLLATLHSPSLSLVGPESMTALAVASLFASAATSLNPSELGRLVALRWGAIILLGLSFFEEGSVTFSIWPMQRVFPSASDYLAGYICYSFGLAIGFNLLKRQNRRDRFVGLLLTMAHFGLLAGSGARLWAMNFSGYDHAGPATLLAAIGWCAGAVLWDSLWQRKRPSLAAAIRSA